MKISARVLSFLALAALLIVFAAVLLRQPPDPVFEGRLTSDWAYDLLSSDYAVRGEAQAALAILGEPSVPQLRALLQRRNGPWEKSLARLSIWIPYVDYRSIDANVCRTRASEMLGLLGPKARAAVPDLVAVLGYDPSASETERALVRIGAASVPALERALNSRRAAVRVRAARLLGEFSPAREATMLALIKATQDQSSAVREEVAHSLGATGRLKPRAVPVLARLSEDQEERVRAAALQALGEIGLPTAEVMLVLRKSLDDPSPAASLEAARSLWILREDASSVVPVLIRILDSRERWRAAYVLADLGPRAAPAAPALARLLAEERVPRPFRTPPSAAFALGKIGAPSISHLSILLADSDPRIRMNALMAFSFMGETGRSAAPALMKLLEDQEAEVRHAAALTLASIGAEPDQIIAGLSACLHAEDIYMRSAAAAVLRDIAPDQTWNIASE